MCEPQRKQWKLGGTHLSYLEWGSPSPGVPPLLLLHGLIAAAETFQSLVSFLPADRHIIALDLPGTSYSPPGAEFKPSFHYLAEMVCTFAAEHGLLHPVLVGHSHGGALALEIAVHRREFPAGLVLLCPAHPFSGVEDRLVRFYLTPPGRLFAHLLPKLPSFFHLQAFRRMPGSRKEMGYGDIAPYVQTLRSAGTVAYMLQLLSTWRKDMNSLREALLHGPLSLPILLLWGDRDTIVPEWSAAGLQQVFSRSLFVSLAGVGHLPNEEAPQECATHITAWLTANAL